MQKIASYLPNGQCHTVNVKRNLESDRIKADGNKEVKRSRAKKRQQTEAAGKSNVRGHWIEAEQRRRSERAKNKILNFNYRPHQENEVAT